MGKVIELARSNGPQWAGEADIRNVCQQLLDLEQNVLLMSEKLHQQMTLLDVMAQQHGEPPISDDTCTAEMRRMIALALADLSGLRQEVLRVWSQR